MTPSKTQRWLDLLALLVGNRFPISIDQIMDGVPGYRLRWQLDSETSRATARRMFERDKDELRRLGIPLETRRYRVDGHAEADGYQILKRDFYLPYLELISQDEAGGSPAWRSSHSIGRVTLPESDARLAIQALRQVLQLPTFPFARDARSALRKLTFDLDPALSVPHGKEDGSGASIRILDRPGGADPEGVLGILLDGLYDRRRISFTYYSIGRDKVERRELEPWGLLYQWGAWYLAARDPDKEPDDARIRLFRADRMKDARIRNPSSSSPEFAVPGDFDIRAHSGRKAWELDEADDPALEVLVRFHPAVSGLAQRNGWGRPVEEEGSTARAFSVRRLDPFLRWILPMAGEAEVISPPEAVEALRSIVRNAIERHSSFPSGNASPSAGDASPPSGNAPPSGGAAAPPSGNAPPPSGGPG